MKEDIPRRIDLRRQIFAERAIRDAIHAVEALPADVGLTGAVILLGQALEKVSDFVDGCDHQMVDSTICLKCGWTPPRS